MALTSGLATEYRPRLCIKALGSPYRQIMGYY